MVRANGIARNHSAPKIGFGSAGAVDDLPGACGKQSADTRADESEGGRQNTFAFVAGADDYGGRTVIDSNTETEAGTCSDRSADESVATTMAISLDGNALNGLAGKSLVSVRGMNDKSIVAHRLQLTLTGVAVGQRYFGFLTW